MTTADWALIISIGSLGLSLASSIWNVSSEFIYPKPKDDVSFGFMTVLALGTAPIGVDTRGVRPLAKVLISNDARSRWGAAGGLPPMGVHYADTFCNPSTAMPHRRQGRDL